MYIDHLYPSSFFSHNPDDDAAPKTNVQKSQATSSQKDGYVVGNTSTGETKPIQFACLFWIYIMWYI